MNFKKYNNITSWIVFAIALTTYALTIEPTVSYWDCGEYISTAVKLEVGHPPGAPLFQMLGAFFAMFTSDLTQIAKMVNFMSALASAFTIFFLYRSIVILAKKMISKTKDKLSKSDMIAVIGSGVVGSLAYTFSDSFWFSAVEAEVYAMSSLLMALLFWLGLRWVDELDKPRGNKWLLLISFIIGLSFGVHILSLLVIPAIVMMYFFKTAKTVNVKVFIIANIVSILVLAFVFKFLFPSILVLFSVVELFFVNNLGLPFNSGTIFTGVLLAYTFYYALKKSRQKNKYKLNTLILSILFIVIGFSSWLMLPIRANANTMINENNPSSARELLAYYNREQYGDANVFYDNYYTTLYDRSLDDNEPYIDSKPKYEKDEKLGKYVIVNKKEYPKSIPNYGNEHKGFIPRMVVPSSGIIDNYIIISEELPRFKLKPKHKIDEYYHQYYSQIKDTYEQFMDAFLSGKIDRKGYMKYLNDNQEFLDVKKPSFLSNLKFMIDYQFGYMYGRYFMWNFVGKQDDFQGQLDNHGNWLSGIDFIDEMRLGSQENLPKEILENKGRNTYYFLPLILGLIGLFFQLKRDPKSFWTLFLFFAFTGFAVIFYTNPKPFEPRERDYAIVGSFYVFAMWIGFGVLALYQSIKKIVSPKIASVAVSILCLIAVPLLMANQNWDDHNRSGRYSALLNAKAYVDSCQKGAIMFTIGDNDTFPLWYLQEVEKYRTDLKLINTSLFATDWYIDQQKRQTYDAEPIPGILKHKQYRTGALEVAYHLPRDVSAIAVKESNKDSLQNSENKNQRIDIKDFMKWIASSDIQTYEDVRGNGHYEKTYPTNKLRLMVDKKTVLKNGIVPPEDADKIVPYIDFDIDDNGLTKNRILMLDILAHNDWKRPIYFTGGAFADEEYLWLKDYLQLDGLAYKLVPIKTETKTGSPMDLGRINSKVMYKNIKGLDWKNSNSKDIYVDEESRKNSISYRNNLNRLAEKFIEEKNFKKAEEILDLSVDKLPIKVYKHYSLSLGLIDNYYKIGNKEKARKIAKELAEVFTDYIKYYNSLNSKDKPRYYDQADTYMLMYSNIIDTVSKYDKVFATQFIDEILTILPFDVYRTEGVALSAIENYYIIGQPQKAKKLTKRLLDSYDAELLDFSKFIESKNGKLDNAEMMKQFDKITPVVEFYKMVIQENSAVDSVYSKSLDNRFDSIYKVLERAM
jgi:MFS family permease